MNLLSPCGWKRLWWQERRQHADTKAAYDNLVIAHHRALAELAEPCRDCATLADHVDVLERDNARLQWENEALRALWAKSAEPMGGLDG